MPTWLLAGEKITIPTPKIHIQGLESTQENNVRAYLSLAKLNCQAPEWRLQKARESSQTEIQLALQALGYYSPSIRGGTIHRTKGCWSSRFQIKPGSPTQVTQVEIRVLGEAAQLDAFRKLMANPPIKTGSVLNHGEYESAKTSLFALAATHGFFDAKLTEKRLLIDPIRREARVHLTLDSGPRYHIGIIHFQPNTLDVDLVERYQSITPGEVYDGTKLLEMQQILVSSEYFDNVELQQSKDALHKRVDIMVMLGERRRHAFSFKAGYSTDTGPRVGAAYENRYLNRHGHRFKSELEISGTDEVNVKTGLSYAIPLDKPTREWLTFAGTYEQVYVDTKETQTFKLGARITTDLGDQWLQTLYADLVHENYSIGTIDSEATPLVLGGSWEQVKKDSPKLIREGHRLRFEALGAPVDFSDGTLFTQARASAFLITSPLASSRILLRGDLGATWADEPDKVPASFRYFAGGDRSVRGYDFESLGPKNANGDVEGGLYLMTGSLEFEQFIRDQWSVAAFVDTGNAFNDQSSHQLYTGAGLGLRWHSPIGPIRVDLAHPFDDPETDVRLHVGIGPEF